MHAIIKRRRASSPSEITLSPLGRARLERLAWVKPDRWKELWRLESERGVHAECWSTDLWKGETGVRFAAPPEWRLHTRWTGVPHLTALGEETPLLTHHSDWLGHAEWRRTGAPSLRWRRTSMSGHRLEDADEQPLLHMRTRHTGWFDWCHEVQIEDAARDRSDLAELLSMGVFVTLGAGQAPS